MTLQSIVNDPVTRNAAAAAASTGVTAYANPLLAKAGQLGGSKVVALLANAWSKLPAFAQFNTPAIPTVALAPAAAVATTAAAINHFSKNVFNSLQEKVLSYEFANNHRVAVARTFKALRPFAAAAVAAAAVSALGLKVAALSLGVAPAVFTTAVVGTALFIASNAPELSSTTKENQALASDNEIEQSA